jgi:hypothetical protein
MSYLNYKPSIYNDLSGFYIYTRDSMNYEKYKMIISKVVLFDDETKKLFDDKFVDYWHLTKSQLKESTFTTEQINSIKDYLYSKIWKRITDKISDETEKLILVLFFTNEHEIILDFQDEKFIKTNYVKNKGQKEMKRVLKILLEGYAEYRVPQIIANELLIPFTQAEIIANPISAYDKILANDIKFYKKKYSDKLWKKADDIFEKQKKPRKINYEKALFEATKFFDEYNDITFDSFEFYKMNNAYKKHRSRSVQKMKK